MATMRYSLVLFLVAVVWCFPGFGLQVWNTPNDYISFTVLKSCLGEELAVQMQKKGLLLGQQCLQEMELQPKDQHGRARRNIFKMPRNPSLSLQMCNMRAWDLLRADGTIQFENVEAFFRNVSLDKTLHDDFLQLSASCKMAASSATGPQENRQKKQTVTDYLNCLNTGGLKACMDYEHRKYFEDLYKLKKALWDSDRAKDLSQFSFSDLLTSDTELLKFLQQVEEYGLCIIKEAPPEPGQIERLTESIGHLKRTHYGLVFSVKIKANANNLAYTEKSLNLHVDQPYLEYKPGVQLLHCISQCEGHGGENILVDSFCVAEKLRQTQPEKFELLTDTLVDFYDVGVEEGVNFHVINQEPIIKLDKSGQVKTVSLNNMVRDSHFGCQPEHVMAWYDAMMTYHDLLSDPQYAITYKMAKGDIIVFDNNRVLHGRKGFHMTGGERHLEGCYWDWDVVRSRRRVLLADAGLN